MSIDHDLAPCGLILNQICHNEDDNPGADSGRPPQQTDDVKNAIRALRADTTHCNGKIGVVGGSSGGSHAVFVAIDRTPTEDDAWPHWFKDNHDDRPDCGVSLSGAYDFSDRTPESYPQDPDPLPDFTRNIENYAKSHDLTYQKSISPVSLNIDPNDFKPLLLINTQYDSMPYHQIVDMICALQRASVSADKYTTITIPDSNNHEFGYWDDWDGISFGPTHLIKGDVINFLNTHLKECDDCP